MNRRRILASLGENAHEVAWIGNDDALANGDRPYVETGIYGTESLGWEFTFDFYPTPKIEGGNLTIGVREAFQSLQYYVNFGSLGGLGWGDKNSKTAAKSLTVPSLGNHVKFDAVNGVATGLGVSVSRPSAFMTPFAVNIFGNFTASNGVGRCCHFVGHIIYTDRQGVTTAEFVPMVRNGVACYWESVGRRWYYPTGGILTSGPRV